MDLTDKLRLLVLSIFLLCATITYISSPHLHSGVTGSIRLAASSACRDRYHDPTPACETAVRKGNQYADLFCAKMIRGRIGCREGCDFEEGYEKEKRECMVKCGGEWDKKLNDCAVGWRDWRVSWSGIEPGANGG
jgi:hypothetical protein